MFEFLDWTRRDIYVLIVLGVVPAVAYQAGNMKWLGLPWTVVALLGTATAFKGEIISGSRAWGTTSMDFLDDPEKSKELVYRHLAWLTALRYQLRENREWEATRKAHNAEYLRYYSIPEVQM